MINAVIAIIKWTIQTYRIRPASKSKVASPTPSTEFLSSAEWSSPQSKAISITVTSVVEPDWVEVVVVDDEVAVVVVEVVVEVVVGAFEDTNRESWKWT